MRCVTVNVSANDSALVASNVCREYNCWDSSLNVLSLEERKMNSDIIQCGLMPCLFLVGAPTNIVSMIVFHRQGLRDRMNLCLFCLAFVDLMYVTALLVNISFCFIRPFVVDEEDFFRVTLSKHTINFVFGFGYSSSFLTMIISTERCLCVLFPMKAPTLVCTRTMAILLLLSMALIQLLSCVYVVKESVVSVKNEATGKYKFVLSNTELFLSHSIFKFVENIVLTFISFFSFSVVILTTGLTVLGLHSAATWRKSAASGSSYLKGQAMLMRMLVVVSCIYILCAAPNIALALARFTVPEFRTDGGYCNIFIATHLIGFLIVMFNSSTNFFVYVTMSSRFRHELTALFYDILVIIDTFVANFRAVVK